MTSFLPHSSHWGSFYAALGNEGKPLVKPVAFDPAPSPLLESFAELLHHPSRIRQPLVRTSWLRGARDTARSERGTSDFTPVSWDVALDLVAEEISRVRGQFGSEAIFGGSYGWSSAGRFHHARSQLHRFLNCGGGHVGQEQNYSYAAAITLLPHILGSYEAVQGPVSSLDGIAANCELMLCFGGISPGNMQIEAGGQGEHSGHRWLKQCADAGVRLVNISPVNHALPGGLEVEWIPIRPNTDTAMMLAMIHVLLDESLADERFLDTYCTGSDRVATYVRGETDGTPKDPRWAEGISGVPAQTIVTLARQIARQRSFINVSWSLQRADHGEQPLWAAVALAAMTGDIGKPGGGFAFGLWSINGMGNPRQKVRSPGLAVPANPVRTRIPVARISDMLLSPGEEYDFNGERRQYPDIRLVYWCGGNPFHHHQELNRLVRAFQKPETVIVQDICFTATARHADIVLPATTTFERNDIGASGRDRYVTAMKQISPPVGDARNDFEIFSELADRLGFRSAFTEDRDEMAWLRTMYDGFVEAAAKQGTKVPAFEEFWEQGFVELPPPGEPYTMFADFRADPSANALATPSGRIELYSERIAGFGYADCPGHPAWLEPVEWLGHEAARDWPLHLITLQPATRLHSQLDPTGISRDSKISGREPCWINPRDADKRGLSNGDVVRIFNARGEILAGALVTDRVMPGVIVVATGAWYDPVTPGRPGSLDKHGNSNVLTLDRGSSALTQAPIAQSALAQVERYEGTAPEVTAHAPPPSD